MTEAKFCFTCGNNGFEDKKCDECDREPKTLSLTKMEPKDVEKFVRQTKKAEIPEEYIGNEWSSEIFKKYHPRNYADHLLEKYVSQLQKVHDMFYNGMIPSKGAIIIAPSTYSKVTWAFSCMQHAIRHGHTVAPMLDTMELKRVLVLAAEKPNYKLYGHIDYDEYIMSDVMFITVTKTEHRRGSFGVIQEILDRRSRKGLGTFIISEVSLEVIAEWDNTNNFLKMKKFTPVDNMKKFPALITYREGLV
jgi:hypothetical protein